GTTRMTTDATIMMRIPMAPNIKIVDAPDASSATVFRGVPTTLNTPALDPILMLDGRQPNLESLALVSIHDHAQPAVFPTGEELDAIKQFQLTSEFFSAPSLMQFARDGQAPGLPAGRTPSERRGRRFFENVVDFLDLKHGLCAGCHSGPMLNQTNVFSQIAFGIPVGTRFQNVLVSERNLPGNPVHEYVFNEGMPNEQRLSSPDLGRSLITGLTQSEDLTFSHFNAFKIPQLRGVRHTAPYFHNSSAKTPADVPAHYAVCSAIVTDPQNGDPPIGTLTAQDQADIVAYLKLLD